jgi:hypothetical protein
MDPLVPFIKAVVIMDGDGKRLSCKVSFTSQNISSSLMMPTVLRATHTCPVLSLVFNLFSVAVLC